MKKKKWNLILLLMLMMFTVTACGGTAEEAKPAAEEIATEENAEIPELTVGWNNELHTGNMHLAFLKPELFEKNNIHLKPVNDQQLELIKDGKTIARINFTLVKGASESVTMMTQGHMDMAYGSSTAYMTAYDSGLDCSILCPVQSGGVAIVAEKDAPYNTFEELCDHAKETEKPITAGYHSPISSPRIVLEYALRDQGVKVTEDTADHEADVVMSDLKGLSNLIPSMSSGQVELWAGPVPNPQNAEAQGIGKIIATLDQLPEGKWVDFPCCTMNIRNDVKEKYPEVVEALVQATTDIHDYAQNNREDTAEALTEFFGLEKEVLMENDTTYSTKVNDQFINGMKTYYEAMSEMDKFTGRLKDRNFDDVLKEVFDFTYVEKINPAE